MNLGEPNVKHPQKRRLFDERGLMLLHPAVGHYRCHCIALLSPGYRKLAEHKKEIRMR